jgi:hypothetical protein
MKKISFFTYLFACAILITTAFLYPKWEKKRTEATLSWDVSGYYMYLPAKLIYGDLRQLPFRDELMQKYVFSASFYQAFQVPKTGSFVMKYPIGMAIMYLPGFLLACLTAKIGGYPMDGFSAPFQFWISWWSLLVAFVGLWMARKLLLRYFDDITTALTLLCLVLATNYLNYAAIDGAMTHNYLFTLLVFTVFFTQKWYEKATYWNSILLGSCIGLATITRPSDAIFALVPLVWMVGTKEIFLTKFNYLKQNYLSH